MGIYKNGNLVAAMHQYQPLQTVQNINNLLLEMLEHRIVEINGKFMSLAQVVYAGLDFTEISELDNKNSTFTADFYLWFRYQGDFDDSAIELINLFKPLKRPLGKPISIWHSPIESGVTTKTYRLKTQFKVELDLRNYPLDQQQLSIYFRHNYLTKNKLIYVVDVQGLGLDKPLKQENAHKFFSIGGWHVNQISFFQDNQTNDSTWGISDFFNTKQRIEYSQFNTVISINRHLLNFILKSLLPVIFLIILGYVSFFVSAFASKLGIGTNLILATSLFHLKLASELPQINYVVLIEYLFYLIYLLALFIIVISILAHLYEEDEGKKAIVNRLNLAGKIIYPLVLITFIIVTTYLNIDLISQAM
jgi:branched-chain amino acid transport system substrate-binding protein